MTLPIAVQARTDIGRVHHTNEDSFAVVNGDDGGLLLLVCDGMGGMGRGDEASSLAVDIIGERVRRGEGTPIERLAAAIRDADVEIRQTLCDGSMGRPGCTAAAAYVVGDQAWVAWVGDSRVYHIRDGEVIRRTRDHKLVEALIEAGELTREEAKTSMLSSVITRALGGRKPNVPPVEVSVFDEAWEIRPGDILLVSSDGLIDLVSDDELPRLLHERTPGDAADTCIETALSRGGHDNITVIVGEWLAADALQASHHPNERNTVTPLRGQGAGRASRPRHVQAASGLDEDDDPSSGAFVREILDESASGAHGPLLPVARASGATSDSPRAVTGPSLSALALALVLAAGVVAWGTVQLARETLADAPAAEAHQPRR